MESHNEDERWRAYAAKRKRVLSSFFVASLLLVAFLAIVLLAPTDGSIAAHFAVAIAGTIGWLLASFSYLKVFRKLRNERRELEKQH